MPCRACACAGQVVAAARGGQGDVLHQELIIPAAEAEEEGRQRPRQLPGVGAEPGSGGHRHAGHERGVLGGEPGQRVLGGRRPGEDNPGPGRHRDDRGQARLQQQRGSAGGVQVVVEQAAQRPRRGPASLSLGLGLLGGVGAEQVVHGVPAGACSVSRCARASSASRARGPARAGSRPGWPRRGPRCPGRDAGPAAGTAAPRRRSARGRTRRTPPGRRWPGHRRRRRPACGWSRAARRRGRRAGRPGWWRRGRRRWPAPAAAARSGR